MKERKILVLFYSFSGQTAKLAREIAEGAKAIAGTKVEMKRVPELLPDSFFEEKPKFKKFRDDLDKEFPVATLDDLTSADGVAFGSPVHFGSFASQLKHFIDGLSPVFIKGVMVNKPAAYFCTSGSTHGGEEAALISMIIPTLNLGMLPVGIPYPIQGTGPEFDAGSPYGAVFTSGHNGENEMSDDDKKAAHILGRRLATMAQILQCGCESCKVCHTMAREEA